MESERTEKVVDIVPTLETVAAVHILREHFPELEVRVINGVDLLTLQPQSGHPHGLSDYDFNSLFEKDKLLTVS